MVSLMSSLTSTALPGESSAPRRAAVRRTLGVLLFLASIAAPLYAEPIGINVLSTQHTTTLWAQYKDLTGTPQPFVSETTSSSTALSELLEISPVLYAEASADLFGVAASTAAYPDFATLLNGSGQTGATAHTSLLFAPVHDGEASLGLTFLTGTYESYFTEAKVSLFDVTANQTLWSYESIFAAGNVPWPSFGCCAATILETHSLLSSHVYELQLQTGAQSSTDSMQMSVNVAGFYRVPEPSSFLLVTLGLIGLCLPRYSKNLTRRRSVA
jgi:PEP-CTERM motif